MEEFADLLVESRSERPKVSFLEVLGASNLASEHTTTDRRVGNDGNTELTAGLEETDLVALDIQGEGRVFNLNCIDVLHLACSTKRFAAALRETDILDLALMFELLHLLDGLLHWGRAIESVGVVCRVHISIQI